MNKQKIATSSTIGSFVVMSITGMLLFFEVSSGSIRATRQLRRA